jgi:hypothetical protein
MPQLPKNLAEATPADLWQRYNDLLEYIECGADADRFEITKWDEESSAVWNEIDKRTTP